MNQSKFSLADVLSVLAALSFGFVSFLGANFMNIGNDKVWGMSHTIGCVVIAIFIAMLLFGTSFGAKLLKKTKRNFKTSILTEVILLTMFVFLAVFFTIKTSPFMHYFTVTAQKEEIKNKLLTSITQAEKMFPTYERYANNRETFYNGNLDSAVAAKEINPTKYNEYGFNTTSSVSDAAQIQTKMFRIHAHLFPTNYSSTNENNGIKEVATEWLRDAKNTNSGWKPIAIVNIVNEIDENSKEWLNKLVTLSKIREQGEQGELPKDFPYTHSFDDVKTHFTKLDKPTPFSIGLAVLAYVLMLLSWFVAKRDTRFPGFKTLFGIGKPSDNEL